MWSIFYTHPRRVTPKPFVQTATSCSHLTTSREHSYTLPKPHTRIIANCTSKPKTQQIDLNTYTTESLLLSHQPAPTSHSQWSSRSTEYTRRSRTCRPEATGSCRNSVERAWASSRSELLRTLCCKCGADNSLAGTRGKDVWESRGPKDNC
jgi:hypothetical protein